MRDVEYGMVTLLRRKGLRNTRKEETLVGCLNNSASIKYSRISCGLTKINSFGPLFSSCFYFFSLADT